MIGTIARSSNSSIASADRPTGLVVPTSGRTRAVEERARARPRPIAPPQPWPIRWRATPMIRAETVNSAAPTPNTSRRIPHSRRNDSSSPIEKSSRMIPNSANGWIASGLEMVT
jgi:hypothetical protein